MGCYNAGILKSGSGNVSINGVTAQQQTIISSQTKRRVFTFDCKDPLGIVFRMTIKIALQIVVFLFLGTPSGGTGLHTMFELQLKPALIA